jgi:hypothetical protein
MFDLGMDVHKESIVVAYVTNEHQAEVVYVGAIGTHPRTSTRSSGSCKPKANI